MNPGKEPTPAPVPSAADDDELRLRGAELEGPDREDAVDHVSYLQRRNPDTELRLDGERDDLREDGLELDDSAGALAGTSVGTAGAKG